MTRTPLIRMWTAFAERYPALAEGFDILVHRAKSSKHYHGWGFHCFHVNSLFNFPLYLHTKIREFYMFHKRNIPSYMCKMILRNFMSTRETFGLGLMSLYSNFPSSTLRSHYLLQRGKIVMWWLWENINYAQSVKSVGPCGPYGTTVCVSLLSRRLDLKLIM
jgi:hypothetical protein